MSTQSLLDQVDRTLICERLEAVWVPHPAAEALPGSFSSEPRPAAVLMPMFRHLDAWHLLFIRRTEHEGDHHSGQVAFPGGGHEPGDRDSVATALREAQEEIGLDPQLVAVLGAMRPFHTVSNFVVTPIVGEIPWPLDLTPDPVEVARVFSIPLSWLADPTNRRVLTWPSEGHPQAREVVFYDEFDQEVLWGVSGRITVDFLTVLGGGDEHDARSTAE